MQNKIFFVIPRNKSLFGDKVNLTGHPHIGISYLSSFLKSQGIETEIYDDGIDYSSEKMLKQINEFKPDLIGITIFSYCYGFADNLIKIIKDNCNYPLAAGGPHASALKSELLRQNNVDFAVKGEGEYTLLELLREIKEINPDFNKIRGLIWRNGKDIIENPDRPYIQNLDTLPYPTYDAFGIERYHCYKVKSLPIITSRGCPFGCNYCSVRLSMGQNFRVRSAENVFSEIRHFYNQGYHSFEINDDCFTLDKQRAEKICDMIIDNKLKIRFQLYNGIRVDTVNLPLLKKMRKAGCFFIAFGCESGSQRVLKIIKKNITLGQVKSAVNWANEAGIRNCVNFIIGHTGETYEDALETLRFARKLPTDFVNFFNLVPYPGTESFEWVKQNAHFLVPPDSFLNDISYRDNEPIFETKDFTKEQRKKITSLGFNLYRKRILTFRLGKTLGNLIFFITNVDFINKLATRFALANPLGKKIFSRLARKSFLVKEENTANLTSD